MFALSGYAGTMILLRRPSDVALLRQLNEDSCYADVLNLEGVKSVALEFHRDRIRMLSKKGEVTLERSHAGLLEFTQEEKSHLGLRARQSGLTILGDSEHCVVFMATDNGRMFQLAAKYGWLKDSGAG